MNLVLACVCGLSILSLLPSGSFAAEAPEIVLIRVPPGWTAKEEGYFLNANALSSLTAASKTYRLERDEWEKAYYDLSDKITEQNKILQNQLEDVKEQLNNERDAWKKTVRRAKSPGIGVFAGYGVTGTGSGEAVVGVGVVWRIL